MQPKSLDLLVSKWGLYDIQSPEITTWNYVVKAKSLVYGDVCLKICLSSDGMRDEINALVYFSSSFVMVTMIEHDFEHHAILLQQDVPGLPLQDKYLQDPKLVIHQYAMLAKKIASMPCMVSTEFKHVHDYLVSMIA